MSKYLSLEFHEARRAKWESGKAFHRRDNPNAEFQGEHCEEAFQECLDLYNYLEDLERKVNQTVKVPEERINLSILKDMTKFIADNMKRIHRTLKH